MKDETVTISKELYHQLLKQSDWLEALEAAGVDNWGGICEAHDILEEMQGGGE